MYHHLNSNTGETHISQNAMNAAEITDKLGLHSLRQRAWVSTLNLNFLMSR